jgi:ABC-type transport system involved in multi-copper enzyme maturation permease subunit
MSERPEAPPIAQAHRAPETPVVAAPRRKSAAAPGVLYAAMRVFELSLGEMLWSRRTVFLGLLCGLPVVIALVFRGFHELGAAPLTINNVGLDGPLSFGVIVWLLFIRFIVPILGVFYGTALIADEVEDKTITYLFTRPIPRSAVLLGKYFAYLVCTIFVVLPSLILVWLLLVPMGGSLGRSFPDLLKDLGLLGVGLAAYGALFALAGSVLKRPLLIGLIFVLGWEPIIMVVPGYLKRLTVAFYLQGFVPHAMPSDSPLSLIQELFRETPGVGESVIWLVIIIGVSLWLGGRAVSKREYVLEQ